LQPLVDLPDQLLAFLLIGFAGLAVEQRLDLAVAVSGDVELGTAGVVLLELLIGVVDGTGAEAERHRIVTKSWV
jgi:hypothetical protein